MKRIAKGGRRFGRIEGDSMGDLATHRIAIGWDTRAAGADRPSPGRLPGFLITRDTLGADGRWAIDWSAMALLGDYTAEKFKQIWSLKDTLAAPPDLLPQTLRFVIMHDALVTPSGFAYPGTVAEEYQLYTTQGRLCHGDGMTAKRKRGDGGVDVISCDPMGKDGCAEFCPYSVRGECKPRARLLVCLYTLNEKGERKLLAPTLGETARFRWETSSEYNSMNVLDALDRVAERLYAPDLWPGKVWMKYLTGVLSFSVRKRISPKGGKVKVQQVGFSIDESAIVAREQEIQAERERRLSRQLEYHNAGFEPKLLATRSGPSVRVNYADPQPVTTTSNSQPVTAATAPTYQDGRTDSEDPPWADAPPSDEQQAEELAGVENAVNAPESDPIEQASDSQLLMALDRYCEARGEAESISNEAVLGTVASYRQKGKEWPIQSLDWFLAYQGKDERQHAARMKVLRRVCSQIADHPAFSLVEQDDDAIEAQAEEAQADAEVAS